MPHTPIHRDTSFSAKLNLSGVLRVDLLKPMYLGVSVYVETSPAKMSSVAVLKILDLPTFLTLARARHGVLVSRHGVLQR